MRRIAGLVVALLGSLALPQAAGASGDYGCMPRWTPASRVYDSCGSQALLAPGNDTRVNLLYLMRDKQQAQASPGLAYPVGDDADPLLGHNFFSWKLLRQAYYAQSDALDETAYSGSTCVSLASGTAAFAAAMQASHGLPPAERERLTQARGALTQRCEYGAQAAAPTWPSDVASAPGREFLAYLQAADAFYAEHWASARASFGALRGASDPWLAEAAVYMLPRTELNAAQATAYGEWGDLQADKVDKPALGRARSGFDDYLRRYGRGRYAASAQGLVRRTLWLGGDAAGLSREYERLLAATPAASPAAAKLVQEVDNKLLNGQDGKAIDGPLLLATIDLMMMRAPGELTEGETAPPVISAAQLAAQEPRFAGRAELYGFVRASHAFYVEKDMPKVLGLIPDDARRPGYSPLAFSRQVLRGMALAAAGDRNAAGFWRSLLGGAGALYQRPVVELALAMGYERSGRLADVFATESPIGETPIREILMINVAGPDLLRAQARDASRPRHERDVALFTLLRKDLGHADYASFAGDVALGPAGATSEGDVWNVRAAAQVPVGLFRNGKTAEGYACPTLAATAAALARNPAEVKGRLCLGEFYRLNGFDVYATDITPPKPDELGGTRSLFGGQQTPRGVFYESIMADPAAAADDKAYALYRAINCYAPSGNNSCGGTDVEEGQRRAWFLRLKREFPASRWAKQLRVYW